ncbi:MAG: DUF1294 domain-containing protein [Burkholderiaceae bacterium]|nr:DUF1294 domain-containing protein [Burkholderiaceae bacterium]
MPLALAALLAFYGAASVAAFLVSAFDKRSAMRGGQRIAERDLHLLALLGGWPGAWLAQRLLRHKTQKPRFRLLFILMVLANCLLLGAALFFLGRIG